MWTYIVRRLLLMIPTLFGVTIVSFCIMQLAPGDPLLAKLGVGGTAGDSGQTRDAFLIQKRDLKLDKPLVFNYLYFGDYSNDIRTAAYFRALTKEDMVAELAALAAGANSPEAKEKLAFLKKLKIQKFDDRLKPHELTDAQLQSSAMTKDDWLRRKQQIRDNLAQAVESFAQVWCEDIGSHGVPIVMQLLDDPRSDRQLKIGGIRALLSMVVNPFEYTFSTQPTAAEEARVAATWKILWDQEKKRFTAPDKDRRDAVRQQVKSLVESGDRKKIFAELQSGVFDAPDAPIFAELLLENGTLAEKSIAAEFLRLYINSRVKIDVPRTAGDDDVAQVISNWKAHYQANLQAYEVGFIKKCWLTFTDTQYAHMVWRLITFDFGRSALRTRDPVSHKIWEAAKVSVPLMLMTELVIYFVAIPLGIMCGVRRGRWFDRIVSLKLFLLYSVPPAVAGMSFLLFFCYGSYLKWFPMERLHSPNADTFGFVQYLLDYLWHAFLPVVCLSLFSLASMAMYSRSSMLDVLGQDYIRTARAKGVPGTLVVYKHALRNGLIPLLTLFASFLPALLGGSVLVEVIFNIPGMGRLSVFSIEQKDFPTLMAITYIDAIVVMLSILMTDLLYVFVDPRISFDSQGKSA